jgi:hypothetical protein
MNMRRNIKKEIEKAALQYNLQLIYAFGSKGKEALLMIEEKITSLSPPTSDLDIGIKPKGPLTVEEKVEIAIFFEELFDVQRVDVVVLPEAPISLALEIVTGEILYTQDVTYEAEYQLFIMKMAAELSPYEKMKKRMVMGV